MRTVKSVRQSVASLSGGQRQTVAIAKAVLWNTRVVLLDEPTAALGVAQTRQVLDLVRRLADHGLGVVLISHNMNDVFEVSDRITALYLGRVAADVKTSETNHSQIVELITAGPLRRPRHLRGHRHRVGLRSDSHDRRTPRDPAADDSERHAEPGRRRLRRRRGQRHRSASRLRAYVDRVRGGDMGALPAVLGLVVLFIVFTILRPDTFTGACNFANLLVQASARSRVLAMGLVLVLLLGEIDLSAGVAGGAGGRRHGRR